MSDSIGWRNWAVGVAHVHAPSDSRLAICGAYPSVEAKEEKPPCPRCLAHLEKHASEAGKLVHSVLAIYWWDADERTRKLASYVVERDRMTRSIAERVLIEMRELRGRIGEPVPPGE